MDPPKPDDPRGAPARAPTLEDLVAAALAAAPSAGPPAAEVYAAFVAGAILEVQRAVTLHDPVDGGSVEAPRGARLRVFAHEGDVVCGLLSDNEHSLGVVWTEATRWRRRKYFLPLRSVIEPGTLRILPPARSSDAEAGGVLGGERGGADPQTAVAVRRIEALAHLDQIAMLPRGTRIHLPRPVIGHDPVTGADVEIHGGQDVTLVRAALQLDDGGGDDPDLGDDTLLRVRLADRELDLPLAVLATLDPARHLATPAETAAAAQQRQSRRRFLWIAGGLGAAAAMAAVDAALLVRGAGAQGEADAAPSSTAAPIDEEAPADVARRRVLSFAVPQAAAVAGWFSAGGRFWWGIEGAVLDLERAGAREAVVALAAALDGVASRSRAVVEGWRASFHREVHVGWREQRHHRTDAGGRRRYTHSTWHKVHQPMWCEPDGLTGVHRTLATEATDDADRADRAAHLRDDPLWDLLAADPADPEATFALRRQRVSLHRDAATSALAMALCAAPPAFFEELVAAIAGAPSVGRSVVAPARAPLPQQKALSLLVGVGAGLASSRREGARQRAAMAASKAALGAAIDEQIARVRGLDFDPAWTAYLPGGPPERLIDAVADRAAALRAMRPLVRSFRYHHGVGHAQGRPLDPVAIDASAAARACDEATARWGPLSATLGRFFATEGTRQALLPVLRNALGADVLDALADEDRRAVRWGAARQAGWFALPLWGAATADALLRIFAARA